MNVYELVTSKIIERLEEGVIPWRKCWTSGPAKSLTTGKEYRGINSVLLGMREYSSRYWVTFRQAQKMGGNVKKGEKATPVVYWHWRTPEEMAKLRLTARRRHPPLAIPSLRLCSTSTRPKASSGRPMTCPPENSPLEGAQKIVDGMPKRPEIRHGASFNPCYKAALDVVEMPNMGQFENAEQYFSALHHEIVHSTGHKSRLNRFEKREGESREERYGFEELVAELGAAFLSATCGLDNSSRLDDASAYIAGWLKALRDDKKLLLQAAGAAQKAADFILGKAEERAEEGRAAA